MITLGIETSCDETAAAILKGQRHILSNVVVSSLKEHRKFGGVVPEIASRAHLETMLPVLESCLKKARLSLKDVDLIAVSQGPGLMGSLLVGLSAAKALSLSLKKPLVGVDHVVAHFYAGFLSDASLRLPCLGLIVSGGHTLIVRMDRASSVKGLGGTRDDAAGEAFDKVAKILGLGYPGGPEIDRLARGQVQDPIFFTRPFLSKQSLDFSFSGIKTAVFYEVKKRKDKKSLNLEFKKRVCAGFQEAVCEVLVQKALLAAKNERLKFIVVGGGVSANSRLRGLFKDRAVKAGVKVVFPELSLCQDNAAMIAALGAALYREGKRDSLELASYSRFTYPLIRTEEVLNARKKK